MTEPIDQSWPNGGLEQVNTCPFCSSSSRKLAYADVQDWSFNCAPGKWSYWDCNNCKSLYLDPRPTQSTIGSAYAKYYTHTNIASTPLTSKLKTRLRNECLSQLLKANIEPRLHMPKVLNGLISIISNKVTPPFGWKELVNLPKGRFIDVGCGAGLTVSIANQLGWQAMGLEIDPAAVSEAQRSGLNILEGTYTQLAQYPHQFDCIMSSHVLEHVHDPLDMLDKFKMALKPGGLLLLTLPNSISALRYHFGTNWRGLEAPRHLSIPSELHLITLLTNLGFAVDSQSDNKFYTAAESHRITRRGKVINKQDIAMSHQLDISLTLQPQGNDFIKLACKAPALL
jgi:2-polyprenyl-3-methyl-5-hydroxy-6-metoxy-1,4-benzoquinol methylase